jgi:hypothetical protein
MRTCGRLALLSLAIIQQGANAPKGAPAGAGLGASAPAVPRIMTAGPKILLEAGQHSPKDLVAMSCTVLRRNELVNWLENPQHETDRITLVNAMEVDPKDFERVVSGLMYTRKYVLTPVDPANGIWEWIFLMGPNKGEVRRRAVFMTAEELRDYKGPLRFVTTTYRLKNMDPQRAANTLRPFYGQDQALGLDPVTPLGGSRALLVTHYSDVVAGILRMLELVDRNELPLEETKALEQIKQLTERVEALEKKLAPATQPPAGK